MVTKARGPYTFAKYTGILGVTAEICAADGRCYTIIILNLIPMHPTTVVRQPSTDEASKPTDSDTEVPEIINPPPTLPESLVPSSPGHHPPPTVEQELPVE